jgi:hypothetical protein
VSVGVWFLLCLSVCLSVSCQEEEHTMCVLATCSLRSLCTTPRLTHRWLVKTFNFYVFPRESCM